MQAQQTQWRDLLEDAVVAVQEYKNPSIDNAQELINVILKAAGSGSPGSDQITYIHIGEKEVSIETEYYAKGCRCSNNFSFPTFILDSSDPEITAKKWGLQNKVQQLERETAEAKRIYENRSAKLDQAKANLAEFLDAASYTSPIP